MNPGATLAVLEISRSLDAAYSQNYQEHNASCNDYIYLAHHTKH